MVDNLNRATSSDEALTVTRRAACPAVRDKADQNCPILLNKLTFNIFSHYITTWKNKKGYYLSKAGYGQIQRSLKHLYRMSGETMDEEYEKENSTPRSVSFRLFYLGRTGRRATQPARQTASQ